MPTYDYFCKANQTTVEVRHRMTDTIQTWGELCRLAEIDPGNTPPDTPVEKLITGGNVISSTTLKNPEPACNQVNCGRPMTTCCGGGACLMEHNV